MVWGHFLCLMNVNDVYIYILIANVYGGVFESFLYILIYKERGIQEGIKTGIYSST